MRKILVNKCKLNVEEHTSDEHFFFKVTANENILLKEAIRTEYKLRMHKDIDKDGMAADNPPYAKVDKEHFKPELF